MAAEAAGVRALETATGGGARALSGEWTAAVAAPGLASNTRSCRAAVIAPMATVTPMRCGNDTHLRLRRREGAITTACDDDDEDDDEDDVLLPGRPG